MIIDDLEKSTQEDTPDTGKKVLGFLDPTSDQYAENTAKNPSIVPNIQWTETYKERVATAHTLAFHDPVKGNMSAHYTKTMDDLNKNESMLSQQYRKEALAYAEQGRADDIEDFMKTPLLEGESPESRLIQALDRQIADTESEPTLNEAMVDRKQRDDETQEESVSNYRAIMDTATARANLSNAINAGGDDSWYEQLTSTLLNVIIPYQDNTYLMDLRTKLDPKFADAGLLQRINFTSNHKEALIQYFNELSPEDYRDKAKMILQAVHSSESFLGSDNTAQRVFLVEEVLNSTDVSGFSDTIDTVVDILDTTMILGAAKLGTKGIKGLVREIDGINKAVKTSVKFSQKVDNMDIGLMSLDTAVFSTPKATSAVGLENLTGTPTGATGIAIAATQNGLTPLARSLAEGNNLSMWLLGPKLGGTKVIDAPDPNLLRQYNKTAALKLTDDEVHQRLVKEATVLSELNGLKLLGNMSEYATRTKDNTFGIRAMYTNGDGTAWNTRQELENALQDAGITKDDTVHLYKRNAKSGQYEYVADPSTVPLNTRGKYLFQLDNFYQFNPKDGDIFDAEKIEMSWLVNATGHRARWLLDVDSRYNKWLSSAMHRMSDSKDALVTQAFKPINDTYFKLSKNSQVKVNEVLEQGHKQEKRFSTSELTTMGLDKDERIAYDNIRKLWDTHWIIDNNDMIRRFDGRGLELFRMDTPGVVKELNHTYVKPHKTNPDNLKSDTVYINPTTGETKLVGTFTQRQANIYDQGTYLAKLDVPHKISSTKTVNYVLVDPRVATQRRLQQTDSILEYKKGYVRRYYDTHYFIRNKKLDETIAASNSSSRVQKALEKLGDDYEVVQDRTDTLLEGSFIDSVHTITPIRTSQRHRGQHLKDISHEGILHGEAQTLDPNLALTKATQKIGSLAVQHGQLQLMKERWLKTYGELLAPDKRGSWPGDVKEIGLDAKLDRALTNRAKEQFDFINHLEGQNAVDAVQRFMKAAILRTAEVIESGRPGIFREKIARTVQKAESVQAIANPVQFIRSVPYLAYLVLNPLRQVVVQSSQLIQMGILDPKNVVRIPIQGMGMALAGAFRNAGLRNPTFKKAYKELVGTQAKLLDIPVKDYIKLERNYFDRSGIPQSIDHNMIVNGVAKEHVSMLRDHPMISWGKSIARAPTRVLRKVGFDLGEQANLMGTYIAAYHRMKKANPNLKLDDKTLEQLSADTRSLSLGMNQAGKFSYNDGIPGIITQFFAVPHKMATTMLGANKAFTRKEKAKLFAWNTFLFGGAAVGADQYMEKMRLQNELWAPLQDLSEGDWETLKNGILNVALNRAYETVVGETTSPIQFSGSLAAAGGVTLMMDRMTDLLDGEHAAALGPGVHYLFSEKGKLRTVYNDITSIASIGDPIDNMETLSLAGRFLSKLASGSNNWMKAKFVREYGFLESTQVIGEATDDARTKADAHAYMLGFRQEADSDRWAFIESEKDRKAGLEDAAKEFVKQWSYISVTRNTDASYQEEYVERMTEALSFAALAGNNERDKADFLEAVERELKLSDLRKNPVFNTIKYVMESTDPHEFTVNFIKTNDSIPDDAKQPLLDFVESQLLYTPEEDK